METDEEMERNLEEEEESERDNWELNTPAIKTDGFMSPCFLCLNNIKITDKDDPVVRGEKGVSIKCEDGVIEEDDDTGKVSLRYICRYLNIDLNEVRKYTSVGKGLDNNPRVDKFSVKLCVQCNSIVSRLSSLCEELELLRMKVNHSFKEFNDALIKNNPRDGGGYLGKNGRGAMRAEIKRKCVQNFNNVLPRVRITKVSQEVENLLAARSGIPNWRKVTTTPTGSNPNCDLSVAKPFPTFSNKSHQKIDHLPAKIHIIASSAVKTEVPTGYSIYNGNDQTSDLMDDSNDDDNDTDSDERTSMPSIMETSSLSSTGGLKSTGKKNSERDSKIFKCTICTTFRDLPGDTYTILRHQMIYHLETLFTSCKDPNISDEDFKTYCHHLLKLEVLSIEPQYNAKTGIPVCQCPFCLIKLSSEENLESHLVNRHKKIIDRKLIDLQKSITVDEIIHVESSKLEKAKADRWKCVHCGETFRQSTAVRKHRRANCPIGPKIVDTRRKIDKQVHTCDICKKQFHSSRGVWNHNVKCHQVILASKPKISGGSGGSSGSACESRAGGGGSKPGGGGSKPGGGGSKPGGGGSKPGGGGKKPAERIGPGRSSSSGGRSGTNFCTLCSPPRKIAIGAYNIFRHQILYHLEVLFASSKDPTISKTDFKTYCQHVLKVEVLSTEQQYSEPDGNPFCVCPYCSEQLSCHYTLEAHMVGKHKDILEKKIVELQRSSSVEELKSFDLGTLEEARRWKCSDCGETFKQARIVRDHKKRNCPFRPRLNRPEWKQFKCSVCKKMFKTRDDFLSHKSNDCAKNVGDGTNANEENSGEEETQNLYDYLILSVDEMSDATVEYVDIDEPSSSNVEVKTEESNLAEDYENDDGESIGVRNSEDNMDPHLFL